MYDCLESGKQKQTRFCHSTIRCQHSGLEKINGGQLLLPKASLHGVDLEASAGFFGSLLFSECQKLHRYELSTHLRLRTTLRTLLYISYDEHICPALACFKRPIIKLSSTWIGFKIALKLQGNDTCVETFMFSRSAPIFVQIWVKTVISGRVHIQFVLFGWWAKTA